MATNLKAKIQQSDKLIIHDVNKDAVTKFQQVNRDVEIVDTVADVANKSVNMCLSMISIDCTQGYARML